MSCANPDFFWMQSYASIKKSLDIWGQDQMTDENSFSLNLFFCKQSCAPIKNLDEENSSKNEKIRDKIHKS
jgi:hypothetical protein